MADRDNVLHFRDVTKLLPKFDPVKGDLNITQWLSKNEASTKHFALSSLSRVATKWRDSQPSETQNWDQWKELLKEAFPCDDDVVTLREKAQNDKWKPHQDIIENYYEKLSLCTQASMTDKESIAWIVNGLANIRFQDYLGPLGRYEKPSKL